MKPMITAHMYIFSGLFHDIRIGILCPNYYNVNDHIQVLTYAI